MKVFAICFVFLLTLTAEAHAEWGYEFPVGPAQWGTLPGFQTCALGASQSPVAIETGEGPVLPNVAVGGGLPMISPRIQSADHPAKKNGHTIQVTLDETPFLWMEKEYRALQFHFHSPSEHILNGRQYPLEAHFVHRDNTGRLLVLGVFFTEGKPNPALAETWQSLGAEAANFSVAELFPRDLNYVTYTGSLTTPPCTENVTWIVLRTPVEADRTQLQFLQKYTGAQNNRPVQSLNGRRLLTDQL